MISASVLKAHINKMNSGIINFSDVELNSRADLVRFEGYSIEEALTISENKMYAILEDEDYNEFSDNDNQWNITCKKCGKLLHMSYTDSPNDGYITTCECGEHGFISVYAIDSIMEANAIMAARGSEVNKILEGKSLRIVEYFDNRKPSKALPEIQTGKLIQKLETEYGEKEEYYLYNGFYFTVRIDDLNRGEIFHIASDKDPYIKF